MKTKLILAGLLTAIGIASAQPVFVGGLADREIQSNQTNGGLQILSPSNGSGGAMLYLTNQQTLGHNYSLGSLGTAAYPRDFSLYNWTTSTPVFHVSGSTGNFGIGTTLPTHRLHTTGGVRFQGLTAGGVGVLNTVVADGSGVLWRGSVFTSGCSNVNFVPKTTLNGGLTCSVIYEDPGTSCIGINTAPNAPSSFGYNYVSGSWLLGQSGGIPGANSNGNLSLKVNGVTQAVAYYATSDERFKKDIRPIDNAMNIINKIEGKTYSWKKDEFKEQNFTDARQIGFIAQELEKVIPEVVITNNDGYKSVNYSMIIPILVQGIKEQQKQIDALQTSQSKNGNSTDINNLSSNMDGLRLDQNVPNPFSDETVINYSLPQQIKNASLLVYDLSGTQVTSLPLEITASSVTITSEKLSPGIYIYSVMADGKIIASKRMVITDQQ